MKRSYTYLKGLLTLALAAFTGWMWAADPVATWTDFNTLQSGNYTITMDAACTVNADGSITLGGAGLSVALGAGQAIYDDNTITVVMDVSGVANEGTLVGFTTGDQPIDLYYTGSKLRQRWATDEKKDSDYGNVDWTPARATIAFAYDGRGQTGTTTYIDGTSKMDTADLRFTGTGSVMSTLTFPATTGMTIHSIRLYSTKLSATDVANISTALNANFISEFNGDATIVVKGSDTAWGTAWDNSWGNNPTSFISTPTGEGFDATGAAHPYINSTNVPVSSDYTVALYANTVNVSNDNAVLWWIGFNTWNSGDAISLIKTDADTVSVRHVQKTANTVYAEYSSDDLTKDVYRLYVVTVDNEADSTTINLYVDGVKAAGTVTTKFTPATGLQIAEATGNADRAGLSGANGMLVDNFYGWNKALTDAEVAALTSVMTPIPAPATYIRTIDANANWSTTEAWTLDGVGTVADVPAEGKDATITATADATITVNATANVGVFTTAGAGTLTIASDGTNTLTAQKTNIEANTIVNAGAATLGAASIANGKTLTVKDLTTVSALSGTGVYNLDLGATTADNYTFAADGKNYKVSSGTFTNATSNLSATQTNYEFAGGTITMKQGDDGYGQFSFGKANVTISGGTINATHLVTVQGGGSRPTTITQTGGDIILSGTGNGSGTAMNAQTIMFGHWPSASSNYLLSGGSLVAENGGVRFGNDSPATMTISDTGLLKVKGIKGKGANASALTITGGKLSIGDWGMDAINALTFTAQGGEINAFGNATINQAIALNGNVTLSADASKTLTIYTMTGTGSLTIAGQGTVALPESVVKTIPVTVAESATLKVIPTMDTIVAGKLVLAEGSTINGTVELEGVENVTANGAMISFTANAEITGSVWWWDYEFNGDAASIGSDTGTMDLEGTGTSYTEAVDGNQALYFQKTPYRGAAFASQDAFTAVMYCQPGNYNNVPLVSFGTKDGTAVILATGANAANGEMQILLNRGNSLTSLADNLIVPNATTANHLYAFTYEVQAEQTVISVYVDGKLKKVTTINERLYVSNGFQIGSVHGGVCTGLTKYPESGDAGTIDFLRVAKGVLSAETMTALAKAYPYVSEKGLAQRTIADATANWVTASAWTQKVTGSDDATQAAPNDGTNVELTATAETQVTVNLDADVSYESLTITGSDVTLVAGEAAKKIVAGDVTIDANVTIPYGVAEIGTLTVNADKTLTFDFSAYDFASVWADRTISLTGLATVADGAEVTATIPETLPAQIQSATFTYNGETQEYALVIDVVEGELTGTIAASGNWDSITWKMGEAEVTPTDFTAMTAVNLIASADATLSMNKAVTVKNLTISGEGALIIAENGGNKLTVSGATTINTNVTATAGAAALGSITINADSSLTIKETIANVGTIASNAGELVYMGDNITEGVQLTNAIGAIRIASGTVNFTRANGDYTTGAITIDNDATMKVSEGQHNSFGNSPITNNGAIVSAGTGAHLYPVVSGTGTLTVESGTLTLHGANTYQGGTTVAGGTLVVSGADAGAKVLPEGKTVTVNANATIQLVAGLSFVTIEGEGKTLVTGTYTYGISNTFTNTLETKTVEVAEGGVLQFRAWRAYALTIDTLIVNGTLKSDGYDDTTVPTVTVDQGQKLSGTGTIELAVTLADGALVGNAEVVPATAVVQGSVTCDTADIATALAEKLTPPTGYRFNVTDTVLSIAVAKVNVTIPAAPANTKWYDADGNMVEAGTIAVDPNTDVTLTLKAEDGYVFADGTTEKEVTVNAGETGATVETPDVTAATPVAQVGETKYQTLADAIAAGSEVTVIADIVTDGPITINKTVKINLGGKTITATNDESGDGVFYVVAGGDLTLDGEGTVNALGPNAYCMAVWADGGKVTIEGGTYTNVGAFSEEDGAHFDLIYVKNGGSAIITGGTFICETPRWTLNSHNTLKGTISITGGKFYDLNPADVDTDDGVTTWCADGYTAVAGEGEDEGYYVVTEAPADAQAKIGGLYYTTFADALADAAEGDTITLLADVTASEIITIEKAITLDGNGKTLTSTAARAINVDCAGAVTIKNLTINAGERAINIINQAATVTINGVTATAKNVAVMIATSAGAATVSIDDSNLTGLMVVGVYGAGADVDIADSTIANVDANESENYGAITVGDTADNAKVDVTNTTITVMDDSKKAYNFSSTATITGVDEVGKVVAMIGDAGFDTIEEAVEYAKAGDTIKLIANVTINSRLDIAQNVTIDLNGQTIAETMEDQFGAIYVKKGATLTIAATNGGEITTDGGIVIGNYGTVIVNGGTIAAGEDAEADVSIYNFYYQADWYGTTTINGGTVARIWNCGVATLVDGTITDVDNSGAMEITADAEVTNIILRDGTDAPGIEGAGTLTAPAGLTVTTADGYKVVYAGGKYTLEKILTLPEELVDSPAAEAIEAAMETAGVTEITGYSIVTTGSGTPADVADVAAVLEVFDVEPTVDANGVLTVTYEFGISEMTNVGDTITITAGVDENTEIRAGVTVAFYADGAELNKVTTTADSTEVSITANAEAINGKKITVKATK